MRRCGNEMFRREGRTDVTGVGLEVDQRPKKVFAIILLAQVKPFAQRNPSAWVYAGQGGVEDLQRLDAP